MLFNLYFLILLNALLMVGCAWFLRRAIDSHYRTKQLQELGKRQRSDVCGYDLTRSGNSSHLLPDAKLHSGQFLRVGILGPAYGWKLIVLAPRGGCIVTPLSKTSESWVLTTDGEWAEFYSDGDRWILIS
jgi:hypothetical protein